MLLAGKVEETPRPLKDVTVVSYEIIHKKDPDTAQKIKQKEVYEQHKELILNGETIVLCTMDFDFNVHTPYKPLVGKKSKVAQNDLAIVAWNFINDSLRTSLFLQFKPYHISAGAIFLAAKFLKVHLPSDGDKVWWQEFDITPRELEDVSKQMLELYEQKQVPASQGSEPESSVGGGSAPKSARSNSDDHGSSSKARKNQSNDYCSGEAGSVITGQKRERDKEMKDSSHTENHPAHKSRLEVEPPGKDKTEETGDSVITGQKEEIDTEMKDSLHTENHPAHKSRLEVEPLGKDKTEETCDSVITGQKRERDKETKDSLHTENHQAHKSRPEVEPPGKDKTEETGDSVTSVSQKSEEIKLLRDKVRPKLEARKKLRGEMTRKKDLMDEDDLIEREVEDLELDVLEDDKDKQKKNSEIKKMGTE